MAYILSYVAYTSNKRKAAADEKDSSSPSNYSIAAFRAMLREWIWHMDLPLRDVQWRSMYGLSHPVFTTVTEKLKPYIAYSNLSLPPDYANAMVLLWLAHGFSRQTLANRYSLEPYMVSKITNMVTRLLSTKLYPEFIKIPVGRRLHEMTQVFEELTSLPNMCGAIDGSPIRIRRVPCDQSAGVYRSKFGYNGVLLQVVADHKKIFWDVCVKAPGGADDAMHLRESLMYDKLTSGEIVVKL